MELQGVTFLVLGFRVLGFRALGYKGLGFHGFRAFSTFRVWDFRVF